MKTSELEAALEEMEYKTYESQFGDERSVSIPAQLRFVDDPIQNTRRFHVELYRRGYTDLDTDPDQKFSNKPGPHYEGRICSREHYDRMKVLVFRGGLVRLFPLDGWDVSISELRDIVTAIEAGFGATLQHDPIEE